MSVDFTPNARVNIGDDLPFMQNQAAATLMGWAVVEVIPPSGTDSLCSLSINNGGAGTNTTRLSIDVLPSGRIQLLVRSTDGGTSVTLQTGISAITAGVRFHVAVVAEIGNDALAIYLNGVLNVSSTPSFTPTTWPNTTADSNSFGSNDLGDDEFFNGQLEDFRLYHRALDAKEIASIHGTCGPDTIRDTMHFRYLFDDPNPGPETLGTAAAADEIGTAALDQIGIGGAGIVCEVSDNKYVSEGVEPTGSLNFAPKLTRSLRRPA